MKKSNYNDGYILIYAEKERVSNFAAPLNAVSMDDLEFVIKLAYEESYKREKDLEFAERSGKSLSIKVKTRLQERVKKCHKVIIGDVMYDIFEIDYDRKNQEMYIFMEEVRRVRGTE